MHLITLLLIFATLVQQAIVALAFVPTRIARHPQRVRSPQQLKAGSIEVAGRMSNGNGNCTNKDEGEDDDDDEDDIADMIRSMNANTAAMNANTGSKLNANTAAKLNAKNAAATNAKVADFIGKMGSA